jgi:hypothetical protein
VIYSHSQIAQYLRCPRAYRYRYLDGWRENDKRASLLFGRAFEKALVTFFEGGDSTSLLFKEWGVHQDETLEYARGDSWERMFRQGVQLLERLAQDNRVSVPRPQENMQVKILRSLPDGNEFVSYLDAIGTLDGNPTLLEWKTTTSRYLEEPRGLVALDPQLICYSWISGISEVAVVAFVRKRFSEIQYLKATITDQQRRDFDHLVAATTKQIEAGQFIPHSGIRFPQNGCVSCTQLGLCLDDQQLVDSKLTRLPGASDLDWLDRFDD